MRGGCRVEMYGKHSIHSHIHNPDLSTYSYIYTYRYVMKAKHTKTFKGRKEITGRGRGQMTGDECGKQNDMCMCKYNESHCFAH